MAKSASDLAILMDVLVDATKPTVPKGGYVGAVTKTWEGLRIGTLDPTAWKFSEELRKPAEDADAEMVSRRPLRKVSRLTTAYSNVLQIRDIRDGYATLRKCADSFHDGVDLLSPSRFTIGEKGILSQIFRSTAPSLAQTSNAIMYLSC